MTCNSIRNVKVVYISKILLSNPFIAEEKLPSILRSLHLYTKIEHANLLKVLNDIIDLALKGGKRKIIAFDNYNAFWATKRRKKSFTKEKLKAVVKHLLLNVILK